MAEQDKKTISHDNNHYHNHNSHNKRMWKRKCNFFRSILKRTVIFSIIMLLLIIDQQQIEAKKYKKEKKIVKSLVKGLIFKNLSTKKNILPMPVPIPGKWQQILNTLIDTSGKLYHSTDSLEHKKFSTTTKLSPALSSSTASSNAYSLLMALMDNNRFFSAAPIIKTVLKLNKNKKYSPTSSSASSSSLSLAEMNNIKKLTRQAAAKYAGALISKQIPVRSSSSSSSGAATSSIKRGTFLDEVNLFKLLSKASHRKSSPITGTTTTGGSKDQNDYLVTFFNLIKLLRQIKELDHTKLLNVNKKSSIFFNPTNLPPPVLTMNINNRKSLLNKMNYIHKLTTDINHLTRKISN